jgi:lambda family phage tail tape measure protein
MSQEHKIGLDIEATYSDKGAEAAKRDLRDLEKEVSKAGTTARDTARHQEGLAAAVSGVKMAAAAAAVTFGGLALATTTLARSWARSAEQIGNLHEKTRMSIEDLSLMRHEADSSNVSLEKLATGLKNLSVRMYEANNGNKQAQTLFRALGVEYTDGAGRLRNARDVMDDVATALSSMSSAEEAAAVSSKLLGRGIGEELMPYLNQGGDKLRAMREEAEALGYKMDAETVKAVKAMNDNLKTLTTTAEGAAGRIAGPLLQSVALVTRQLLDGIVATGGFWRGINALANLDKFGSTPAERIKNAQAEMKNINDWRGNLEGFDGWGAKWLRDVLGIRESGVMDVEGLSKLQQRREVEEWMAGRDTGDVWSRRSAPRAALPPATAQGKTGSRRAPAKTRQQQLEEQDRRNWVRHADQVFADADRENLATARDADIRIREQQREAEALDKLARSYRDMIDPMQPLRRQLAELDKLFAAGKISSDEYTEGMFNVQNRMEDLNVQAKELKDDGLEDLKNALHGWGRESSREIGRMVVDGEFNLKRLGNAFKNLAADIIASQVQKQWMDPLVKAGTSWLGGLFGGGDSGVDTNIANANALGNAYGPQGMVPFAMGGIVRRPTLFKFADGGTLRNGLMGEAGEEGILPLKRGRDGKLGVIAAGGAGNIRVEIINQGAPQEVVSAQPSFDIDGMVVQIVTRDLRQGGPIRGSVESLMRPVS